jgi:hypothetical protein
LFHIFSKEDEHQDKENCFSEERSTYQQPLHSIPGSCQLITTRSMLMGLVLAGDFSSSV